MASYEIAFKSSVEKDLLGLPKSAIERVVGRIELLSGNPFPRQSVKLAGAKQVYRVRAGDYRIVYSVDKTTKQVLVHYVRHRRDAYRRMR
jgi:mRNA interferase RelE/StbE